MSPGQLSLNFEEWVVPDTDTRPVTPASADLRSMAMRGMGDIPPAQLPMSFISFGSGSSGNSCYIGNPKGGIIIDAGVDADYVTASLKANGVGMEQVKGICLTHDHSDHVKYVYKLLRTNKHLRLFCTPRVLNGILRRHNISKRIKDYHCPVHKEFPFWIADMEITPFDVPHDASDNVGYCIRWGDKVFTLATDMGTVSERPAHYMALANFLMVECNYDLKMLLTGRYPEYLKARIRSDRGHMDNDVTADFLAGMHHPGLRHIFLCHLSADNNTPAIALAKVKDRLTDKGIRVGDNSGTLEDRSADLHLIALPRHQASPWMQLR